MNTNSSTSSYPLHVVENAQAMAEAVKNHAASGQAIINYGHLHAGLGHLPSKEGVALRIKSGIVDHWVTDMAIRVTAGTTIREIQQTLAAHDQWLPIDTPDDELTIGELVDHHFYAGLRTGYGSLRDLLLGLQYVNAKGELITVGGRTVKNVAGYDVTKLMVGAMGTLGCLTELTLRTYAMPACVMQVSMAGLSPRIAASLHQALLSSDASPVYMTMQKEGTAWQTTLAYYGTEIGCAAQCDALGELVDLPIQKQLSTLEADDKLRKQQMSLMLNAMAWLKIAVAPSHLCDLLEQFTALSDRDDILSLPLHGIAHLGGDWTSEELKAIDEAIVAWLKGKGFRCVMRVDQEAGLAPFAPAQPDWPMQKRLKTQLDPHNIFNPRRFLV